MVQKKADKIKFQDSHEGSLMLQPKATWVKMCKGRIKKKLCRRQRRSKRDVQYLEGDTAKLKFNAAEEEQQVELNIPEGLYVQQDAEIFLLMLVQNTYVFSAAYNEEILIFTNTADV